MCPIKDNIDLPFVDDPEIIGEWRSVDFVTNPEDFTPGKKNSRGSLYLKRLSFIENGEVKDAPWFTWTRGVVIHKGDSTASKYIIKTIDNNTFMFFEWKSGDYTIRGMKPRFYVLSKVSHGSGSPNKFFHYCRSLIQGLFVRVFS